MAIDDESSSSSFVSSIRTSEDVQSFNSVHDNLNLKIISQLLDGLNYVRWAQSMKLFVGGREKIGFLLGTEINPPKSDSKYVKWFSDYSMGTQTLGMYYAKLRSSWEELSHYDSFIEWPASAPSENVLILPTAAEIYSKIVKKTRAHAYCLSDQSRRSPMPLISGIFSETSAMVVRYTYPAPPSVPS
ncbi:hypothetical protein GIB67_032956 [Kingdonia uniflora]|uniref:Retrotransposon Copia-like N-terminal domain-containing protein n=1 Tax=Kingdonia uniflora TaxID=39325 RepID=A0A7J7MYM9_9MAGN|nr:hypothetical protein GIB67_032956 [Kingdonia uniflora]